MTIEGRTEIKKAFLASTTRRVQFQIVNRDSGLGFQPDTLVLSIYDVVSGSMTSSWASCPCLWPYQVWPYTVGQVPVTSSIVNGQNDVDISAFVDTSGFVDVYLSPADTTIDVPAYVSARPYHRVLLFTWTWDSPVKTAKHEIVLAIAPDRETVAT